MTASSTSIPLTQFPVIVKDTSLLTPMGRVRYSAYAVHAKVPGATGTACGRFLEEEITLGSPLLNVDCRACQKMLAAGPSEPFNPAGV